MPPAIPDALFPPLLPEELVRLEDHLLELADRLGAESRADASAAARELVGHGALAARALVEVLHGGRALGVTFDAAAERRRRRALRVLVRIGLPAARPMLDALGARQGRTRQGAAWVLARLGAPAVEALVAALADWRTRPAAARALPGAGKAAVPALTAFLRRERPESSAWHAADAALCRIVRAPTLRQVRGGGTPLAQVAAGVFAVTFAVVFLAAWRGFGTTLNAAAGIALASAYAAFGLVLVNGTPLADLPVTLAAFLSPLAPILYWFWPEIRSEERKLRAEFERTYLAGP